MTDRTKFLGSSDAAGVLGLSRWATPLSVWAEKTGNIVLPEKESEAIELGRELESYVAKRFSRITGKKVARVNEPYHHKKHPFLAAQIDRRIVGEKAILEAKTASAWKAKEWKDGDIPMEYIIQVYHQLAVTGVEKAYIAVLIGNQEFKWKEINRDEKVLNDLVKKEVHFWNTFVVPNVMPTTIKKQDADTLDALFPVAEEGKEIVLPENANQLCDSLEAFKEDKKNLEGLIDQTENELKAFIKGNEIGVTSLRKIFWTNQSRKSLDTKKLKSDNPELYDTYAKVNNIRVFKIKSLMEGQNGDSE